MGKLNICSGSEWLDARSELSVTVWSIVNTIVSSTNIVNYIDTWLLLMHVDHRCFFKNFDSKLGMGRLKGHDSSIWVAPLVIQVLYVGR
jgi:hypothetical protein